MPQAILLSNTGPECASAGFIHTLTASRETQISDIATRLRHTSVLIGTLVNDPNVNDETASLLMCIFENVNGARLIAEQSEYLS
ncbi:MAG: hypothetical protein ACR2O7_08640 [Parasphingorhabdus sp.]